VEVEVGNRLELVHLVKKYKVDCRRKLQEKKEEAE
jgi:hypothetical protein